MRVLVCGGRDFADVPLLWRALDRFEEKRGRIDCLIDGASDDVTGPFVGADYWGHQWALARGKTTARLHAEWRKLGRSAGPIRNERMIKELYPHVVMAFAGGSGTANMIEQARKAEIEVIEIGKK